MTAEQVTASQATRTGGAAMIGGVGVLTTASTLVTGTVLARVLGPDGRGALAAILVPIGLAPYLMQFGTGLFVVRRVAVKGPTARTAGEILGSVWLVLTLLCIPLMIAGQWLARELLGHGGGDATILGIGFQLIPLSLLGSQLSDIAWGASRWGLLAVTRLLPAATLVVAYPVLALTGHLTVVTAAVTGLAANSVPTLILLPLLRGARPVVSGRIVREAFAFGLQAWPGTIANLANQRLDQLLMIPLVPERQLGLYTVAVTLSGFTSLLVDPLTTVSFPEIAAGRHEALATLVRTTILVLGTANLLLVLGSPLLITVLLGHDFTAVVPLMAVLAVANVLRAGQTAMALALAAAGHPRRSTTAEVVALVITVPGLLLLLPPLGAMGACIVSVAAYAATGALLARACVRTFGLTWRSLFIPRRGDVVVLRAASLVLARRLRLVRA